jgi:integrase/recombinase XerD
MTLREALRRYLVWLRASGASPRTLPTLQSIVRAFLAWTDARDVRPLDQLTPDILAAYQQELTWRQTRTGRPITITTQLRHLGVLRGFGRWLLEQDLVLSDPAKRLRLPRKPQALPRAIPAVDEAARLVDTLAAPTLAAYRDQAILELLYSTGLRRGEVVNLDVGDVDLLGGYCWVRQGKGRKDRVVPLGRIACARLQGYLDAVRPALVQGQESGALFLNRFGGRLCGPGIYQLVKKAVARARLSPALSPHALRHAAATHMLRNGAPLRQLQEFLGHASVETTQVYTRITIPELKAVHAKYHPREQAAD